LRRITITMIFINLSIKKQNNNLSNNNRRK